MNPITKKAAPKITATAIGKMDLPVTFSGRFVYPQAETQTLVIYEVKGERCVKIGPHSPTYVCYTRLSDLYVDDGDGLLKGKAPLRVRNERLVTDPYTMDSLPVLDPVEVPHRPVTSKAQIRASAKYDAENTTKICLKFNDKTDADILKKLSEVDSKQGYIKALIREDLLKG